MEHIEAAVESVGLGDDAGADTSSLDQASFFRAVQDGNVQSVNALVKNRKHIDLNAYNDQGVTPLILAVYKYEVHRSVDVVSSLLKHGANVSVKAAPTPSNHKMSIVRHDMKNPDGSSPETKKIVFDHKTPLLIALELKSSLYLKGWEYRHWDAMLEVLSEATVQQLVEKGVKVPTIPAHSVSEVVQRNWDAVFNSGKHETIELTAEGKDVVALKLLVTGASKVLKMNLEHSSRMELKEASYNITKGLVHYLYVGKVEPHFMQQRGIDLFVTAHKYGVEALKHLCEANIVPNQDNWIKLLTAAVETDSQMLTLKTAQSIKDVMAERQSGQSFLTRGFSDIKDAPQQLFQSSRGLVG
ncbi:hypothetical protein MPTK1_1g17760 [Marchantia polymorpha subsp. ruderalis]|uniref:BTB domain-containing protein n=2 Tax=Marchantia polymorpha TaxID=3197 RepID=A0AAF6ARB1_MARPO|nr:hypothetical protein MARPO_0001s0115 [Marchantia polymorpha]BBM98981.1 hypothetical protein Mp_1g17760 [Marchantia polymorpha subsp. ruderalis]|eukprot:PTQ50057.1 hypothetical protein MARPO_0001s0115 [Marchantia polymorpha]